MVQKAADEGGDFVVVGESFSGSLALMLATRRPVGLRGVVLCASFVRFPLPVPERWRGAVRPGCWELVRSVRPDAKVALLPGPHLVLQVAPAESAAVLVSFCDQVSAVVAPNK